MKELCVYSREGCHLCEDMLDALAQFATELGYRTSVYDVDEDETLYQRFNTLVPIVFLEDKEVMRYFFELATLKAVLNSEE